MININADGFFTGTDPQCQINGKLPKSPKFITYPNEYDTACMTIATCDMTEKYVPFCEQVLNKDKKKSIEEFKGIVDMYLNS